MSDIEEEGQYDFDAASAIFERLERSLSLKNSINSTFMVLDNEDADSETYYDPENTSLYDIDLKGTKALLITANRDKHRALRKIQQLQEYILDLRKENAELQELNKRSNLLQKHSNVWKLPSKLYLVSQRYCCHKMSLMFQRWKAVILSEFRSKINARYRTKVLLLARKNIRKLQLIGLERSLQKWKKTLEAVDSSLRLRCDIVMKKLDWNCKRDTFNCIKTVFKRRKLLRNMIITVKLCSLKVHFDKLRRQTASRSHQLLRRQISIRQSLLFLSKSHIKVDSVRRAFYIWLSNACKLVRLVNAHSLKSRYLTRVIRAAQHRQVRRSFKQWFRVIATNHYKSKIVAKILKSIGSNRNSTRLRCAFKYWAAKSSQFDRKSRVLKETINKWSHRALGHYFHRWGKRVHHDHLRIVQRNHNRELDKMRSCQSVLIRLKYVLVMKVYFKMWRQQSLSCGVIHVLHHTLTRLQDVSNNQTCNLAEESKKLAALKEKYSSACSKNKQLVQQYKHNFFCKCVNRMWKFALYRAVMRWKHATDLSAKTSDHETVSYALKRKYTHRLVFSWLKNATGGKVMSSFKRWQITSRKISALLLIRQNVVSVHTRHLLHQWHAKYSRRRKLKGMLLRLSRYVVVHSLSESFQVWRRRTTKLGASESVLTRAIRRCKRFVLKNALTKWNKSIHHSKYAKEIQARVKVEAVYKESQLHLYWSRWKQYMVKWKLKRTSLRIQLSHRHTVRVKRAFNSWKIRTTVAVKNLRCKGILKRVSKRLDSTSLRVALSKWKSLIWHLTCQHQLELSNRLTYTLNTIQSLTSQQDQLEHHNHVGMEMTQKIEFRNGRFFNQIMRMLLHARCHNLVGTCLKSWIKFHLSRRGAKLIVVKYSQKLLFYSRMCAVSHSFHQWVKVTKSTSYANDWSLLMKKRELLQTTRLHMTQWKSFNQQKKLLAKSFRAHMYHVYRFSTVRSIYYAFYKWKAHHIVEHNYWISVTSRLFNRWAKAAKDAKRHRARLLQFSSDMEKNNLKQVFQCWRTTYLKYSTHRRVCQVVTRTTKRVMLHWMSLRKNKAFQKWKEVVQSYKNSVTTFRTVVRCGQRTVKQAIHKWKKVVLFHKRQITAVQSLLTRRSSVNNCINLSSSFHSWKLSTSAVEQGERRDKLLSETVSSSGRRYAQLKAWRAWRTVAQSHLVTMKLKGPQIRAKMAQVHEFVSLVHEAQQKYLSPEGAITTALEGFSTILPSQYSASVYYRLQHFPMIIPATPNSRMTEDIPMDEDILWGLFSGSQPQTSSIKKHDSVASLRSGLSRVNSRSSAFFFGSNTSPNKSVRINEQLVVSTPYLSARTPGSVYSFKDVQSPKDLRINTNDTDYLASGVSTFDTMRSVNTPGQRLYADCLRYSETRHSEIEVGDGMVGECALSGRTKAVYMEVFDEQISITSSVVAEVVFPLHCRGSVVGVVHIQCPYSNRTMASPGILGSSSESPGRGIKSPKKSVFTFEDDAHRSAHQTLIACMELKLDEAHTCAVLALSSQVATTFGEYFFRDSQIVNASELVEELIHHESPSDVNELAAAASVGAYEYLRCAVTHGVMHKSTATESGQEMNKLREQIHKLKQSRSKHINLAKELHSSLEDVKSQLMKEQQEKERVAHQLKKCEDKLGKYAKHQQEVQMLNQEVKSIAAKTFS